MGIIDHVEELNAGVFNQVHVMLDLLDERLWLPPTASKLQRLGLSQSALAAVTDPNGPPIGIYGVGVVVDDNRDVHTTVFTVPEFFGKGSGLGHFYGFDIRETPVASLLRHYGVRGDTLNGVQGLTLPAPRLQKSSVKVGSSIRNEGMRGTCGVRVQLPDGKVGALTAGHAVPTVGTAVKSGISVVGLVDSTSHLRMYGPDEVVADVGVIRFNSDVDVINNRTVYQASGKLKDSVVVDTVSGSRMGWIRAVVSSFALQQSIACWTDVMLTDRAVSTEGDSGAPAYLGANDNSMERWEEDRGDGVLGHVVAGHERVYSVIQDIDAILSASEVSLAWT